MTDPLGLTASPVLSTTVGGLQHPGSTAAKPKTLRIPKGTSDICRHQPDLCNSKFAKSRRFIFDGDAPPDAAESDRDTAKSAHQERERISGLLDRLAAQDGLLGRLGGDNTTLILRMDPNGDLLYMRSGGVETGPSRWERWRGSGGLWGWWGRTFPNGWAEGYLARTRE